MAIAPVADANAHYTSASSGATTAARDTTGANLIILNINGYGTGGALSDNKGNTSWTELTAYNAGNQPRMRTFYCANPNVGAGHTFTLSGSNLYGSIFMSAWSGVDTADALEAQNGSSTTSGGSSRNSGTVSPANDGALILAHYAGFANPPSFSGSPSFTTLAAYAGVGSVYFSAGQAYYIQPTAGSINSGWSWPAILSGGLGYHVAQIVAFNAAATGYTLSAEAGSYALTGAAAGLLVARTVAAGQGDYTLAGADATLTYGSVTAYSLTAETGGYTLTGANAGLIADFTISATAGSYSLSGADAGLKADHALAANAGYYALTGASAGVAADRVLTASGGTYTLFGADAGIEAHRTIAAGAGAYVLTGADAGLIYTAAATYTLAAEAGAYILIGGTALLQSDATKPTPPERVFTILPESRTYTIEAESRVFTILPENRTYTIQ